MIGVNEHSESTVTPPMAPFADEPRERQHGHPEAASECGSEHVGAVAANHKNHARKRTQRQRQLDLEQIDRLSREGLTQAEIAEAISTIRSYKISRSQVKYDQQQSDKAWRERFTGSIAERRLRELEWIERLEQEALFGWNKSLEPRTSSTVNSKGIPGEGGERKGASNRTQSESGNPSFLKVLIELEKLRCKLLGLFSTTGYEPPPPLKTKAKPDRIPGFDVNPLWSANLGTRSQRVHG